MFIVIILVAMKQTLFSGFIQMAAGLSVGLSCLAGKCFILYQGRRTLLIFFLMMKLVLPLVLLVMLVYVLLLNNLECSSEWLVYAY
jgi:V-type H+-transporting ATPase proteolipid subunit